MKINKKLLFSTIFIMFSLFALFSCSSEVNAADKQTLYESGFCLSLSKYSYKYTGEEIKPTVTMKNFTTNKTLKEGTDYTVSYKNNVNVGYYTASVTVTGKGNYSGSTTTSFSIYKYDLSKSTVSSIPDQTYNGKQIEPSVGNVKYKTSTKTLTLKEETDYTVSYPIYSNKVTPIGQSYIYLYGKGNYSGTTKCISFNVIPPKVKNVKTALRTVGIKVSWDESSTDIDGYEIYRKTSTSSEYKILANISSDKNYYMDRTPATTGKTYYYKVRAYKTVNGVKMYSKYSDFSKIVFAQAVDFSVTSKNDRATIKSTEINGADGYEIYRSTSKDGNYVKIKTEKGQTNCTYTDKDIDPFKTYYYKVRCYADTSSGKVYSLFLDPIEKTPLAKTDLKESKYTGKTIELSWNKIDDIDGYKIYRATSYNGTTYTCIAKLSANKTTYTDKNLTQGKVYKYKIRAYKIINHKTIYGDYSDIKIAVTGTRTQQLNQTKLVPDQDFKNSGFKRYYTDYEKLINKYTNYNMSKYTKVKTMYKYLVEHLYHKDGYNCKNFAGTFAGICRVMGLDAYCATGETRASGGGYTAHTWTIVNINSTEYIFDASLDRHAADRTKKICYNYFFKTYSELPEVYKLYGYENYWPFFMVPGDNLK